MKKVIFNIYHVIINDYNHIFDDLIVNIVSSLKDLNYKCTLKQNSYLSGAINILIGSTAFASKNQKFTSEIKGKKYIVFQLEQLSDSYGHLSKFHEYLTILRNAMAIWDYSPSNIEFLRRKGFTNIYHVPIGFHRNNELFRPRKKPAIDVIFIGSQSQRRSKIINELIENGVKAEHHNFLFGEERDRVISNSKIAINIHATDELKQLETPRVSFLLTNRVLVVSEESDHNPFRDGVIYSPYDQLVSTCLNILKINEEKREKIAEKGYMAIRKLDMVNKIQETLSQMIPLDNYLDDKESGDADFKGNYHGNYRTELLPFIPCDAQKILDIGCAAGFVGKNVKKRQICHITGIEIFNEAALHASKILDLVICGDVFKTLPVFPDEEFDCILMLDVIEHLDDSIGILKLVEKKITADGVLVLSVPNISHWTIFQELLEGNWNYTDQGILDKTQVKFFTPTSLSQLLNKAGFKIIKKSATKINRTPPSGFIESLKAIPLNKITDNFEAFQIIFICQKK